MDIKDLNKPQLILLALLLSFVTSIATGITTVTLMEQAPPSFTVPINRVIKQTVEKIEQVEGKTTVQTVIVKEEDLVVDALQKNKSAIFTLSKEYIDAENNINEVSAGRGFAVSADGIIAVDATLAPDKEVYYAKNESGKFKAEFVSTDKSGFSLIKIGAPLDPKNKLVFTAPALGDWSKMKTGQKILVMGNTISSYIYDGNKDLRLPNITKSNAGSMVLNLDGEVLGIALSGETSSFAPVESISSALKVKETPATP
jgi:S1-C subfamily serine protease